MLEIILFAAIRFQPQPYFVEEQTAVIEVVGGREVTTMLMDGPAPECPQFDPDNEDGPRCSDFQSNYCWGKCASLMPGNRKLTSADCTVDGYGNSTCSCYSIPWSPSYTTTPRGAGLIEMPK